MKIKTLTDEDLIHLIVKNNTHAFDELYSRYAGRILNYFYRMLGGNQDKSQDFLQDLFVKLLEKAHLFKPKEKCSTWLYTIAHNMCRNEYRRQSVRNKAAYNGRAMQFAEANNDHNPDHNLDIQSLENALKKEVEKLDDNHRTTFILRYQENMSIRDISRVLNCSEGTTKSRLHYTTRELMIKLKEYNPL